MRFFTFNWINKSIIFLYIKQINYVLTDEFIQNFTPLFCQ